MTVVGWHPQKTPTRLIGKLSVGCGDCLGEALNVVIPQSIFVLLDINHDSPIVSKIDHVPRRAKVDPIFRGSENLYPVRIVTGLEQTALFR
jgi:hypothetical protein